MWLDMRPMGKPFPWYEKRFWEILQILQWNQEQKIWFFAKIMGKKPLSKDELLEEWYANQTSPYETIKAPRVWVDKVADDWIEEKYNSLERSGKVSKEDFIKKYQGNYVADLAEKLSGVPVYGSDIEFRGNFLSDCNDVISQELIDEAWETKLAGEALDYWNRLMQAADIIAQEKWLEYLKNQRDFWDIIEQSIEEQLHIVYSLAHWLIFYGERGHWYEGDY